MFSYFPHRTKILKFRLALLSGNMQLAHNCTYMHGEKSVISAQTFTEAVMFVARPNCSVNHFCMVEKSAHPSHN